MKSFQEKIRKVLKDLFLNNKDILAVWEGGSAATGFLDEMSDLDLALIAEDDLIEDIFNNIEKFLEKKYGISHKFRMPEPNWHGHSQCFYILENSPETFYVDLLIEKKSAKNRFLEPDRHGNAVVWFDRENLIDKSSSKLDEIEKKCRKQFRLINSYLPFTFIDLKKQIKRRNFIDAVAIYFSLINRFNVLLNIKFRPAKYDFGLRYLYRDFPEDIINLIEDLLTISNLEDLLKKVNKVENIYKDICFELEKKYSSD